MKAVAQGVGIWTRGIHSFQDLENIIAKNVTEIADEYVAPRPDALPSRERRRAGLMTNSAVTVAHQACEHAGVDKANIASVFASSLGDTAITDYLCTKLTTPEKLISPTKFHNSVHNAASGYWGISTGNRAPSTFISGAEHSFAAGLLEAASQAEASEAPILLVGYDIANHAPIADSSPIHENFALALVLSPRPDRDSDLSVGLDLDLVTYTEAPQSSVPQNQSLSTLAAANPMAESLTLLEMLVEVRNGISQTREIVLPAAEHLALSLTATAKP